MERFLVTYRLHYVGEEAKQVAKALSVEQTIEFPFELVTNTFIKEVVTGRIESLEEVETYSIVKISYDVSTTALEATQFLNVVFGNSSLLPGIWVEDIQLTASLVAKFKGPRYGLAGIRQLVGVNYRPMLQAVIKPMGSSVEMLEKMCFAYAKGGAEVIKDDHGITNQRFSPFEERVKRCADAVARANAITGGHTLYAANISGDGTDVLERAYLAKEAGATALMVAPALIGYGWLHKIATDENLQLPVISHPAFMGGFVLPGLSGISRNLWMAKLPRLFGADMSIFVSYEGRFTFTARECKEIQANLVCPWSNIAASCPAPGGGVTAKALPELIELYGKDCMFLVGGDMFRVGPDLEDNIKFFINILEKESRI